MKRLLVLFLVLQWGFIIFACPSFMDKSPKDGLIEALEYYGVHHKEIVYAQAIWETGYFKSKLYLTHNNLFGLKGRNGYMKFSHWSESVIAYKNRIQNRYKEGENYYLFLKRIRYASDSRYIQRIKNLVNNLKF